MPEDKQSAAEPVASMRRPIEGNPRCGTQSTFNPKANRTRLLTGVAVAALMAGIVAAGPIDRAQAANAKGLPQSELLTDQGLSKLAQMPDFSELVGALKPAVVSVRVKAKSEPQLSMMQGENPFKGTPFEKFFRKFGDQGQQWREAPSAPQVVRGQGSAFFISPDGYLVTNNHVVDNAMQVEVVMDDGSTMPAEVVGVDPKTDVALLKVSGRSDFPYVKLSNATPPIGSWVIAMGNPFGLGGTVTAGIVSAKGRDIGSGPYDDYIQIDAPVNSGNSGGPTFNLKGEVIGVNTAIFSPSGGNVGIAFDIPAPVVSNVVAQLREKGHVERGWLGVQVQPVTAAIADSLGLKDASGALVSSPQPNSPAAKAGLRSGDIILKVGDDVIKDARDLARTIAGISPGTRIPLTVLRNGTTERLSVHIGEMKNEPQKLAAASSEEGAIAELGLKVAPASSVEGAGEEGVAVLEIDPAGPAADLGIEAGDVIKRVGDQPVSTPAELGSALQKAKQHGREHTLALIQRSDNERYVALPVG